MENESVEMTNVAESSTEVIETPQEISETKVEVAEQPKEEAPKRDFEKDSAYAKLRRENQRLIDQYKQFGFTGETAEEILDKAEAYRLEKPVEEITAERKQREELELKEAELEHYRKNEEKRMMDEDLKTIQSVYPDIKSLDDLGETYFELIGTGKYTAVKAAIAAKALKESETVTPPPSIGQLNQANSVEKEFYTSEEIDKLSPKELDNPKIMEKVMKSMLRLK